VRKFLRSALELRFIKVNFPRLGDWIIAICEDAQHEINSRGNLMLWSDHTALLGLPDVDSIQTSALKGKESPEDDHPFKSLA
jgi:hypothetical protein